MHVLFLHSSAVPGTAAASIQILRTAAALAERLAPSGGRVTVCAGPGDDAPQPSRDAVAAAYFDGGAMPENLTVHGGVRTGRRVAMGGLPLSTRGLPPVDVAVVRGLGYARVIARMRRARVPVVLELHRVADTLRRRLAEAACARRSSGYALLTPAVKEDLVARYGRRFAARPQVLLPSGVGPPLAPEPEVARDIDVIYAGKLEPRKGTDRLPALAAALPADTAWGVFGDGPDLAALQGEAAPAALRAGVRGRVSPAAVAAAMSRARVGVCPLPARVSAVSERYTSPMKILEMWRHGVAVVASDLPSVRNLVSDGVDGVLVPPDDGAALAAAVAALLTDASRRARLADAGRRRAAAFAWPARASTLDGLLRQVAVPPGG